MPEWQSTDSREDNPGCGRDARGSSEAPPEARSATSRKSSLMFDLAAIAIALACFAFLFLVLYVLERV